MCVNCETGCAECDNFSGACTQCEDGLNVEYNGKSCSSCSYAVGPVGDPFTCVSSPYSDTRLLPPYDASEKEIDWREWGIV